jgi:hypothetical protein
MPQSIPQARVKALASPVVSSRRMEANRSLGLFMLMRQVRKKAFAVPMLPRSSQGVPPPEAMGSEAMAFLVRRAAMRTFGGGVIFAITANLLRVLYIIGGLGRS